jgi:hypothetical protein
MLTLVNTVPKHPPCFAPGEEVFFDIPDYGQGRGHVAGAATHPDGTNLYAVYPKNPRITTKYPYVCVIVAEKDLISCPF